MAEIRIKELPAVGAVVDDHRVAVDSTSGTTGSATPTQVQTKVFSAGGGQRLFLTGSSLDANVPIRGNGGTLAAVAIAPDSSDPNTGLRVAAADELELVAGGVQARATVKAASIDATVPIRGSGGGTGAAAIAPNSGDPDTGLKATVANELRVVAGDVDTLIVKAAEVLGATNVDLKLQGTGEYKYAAARSTTIAIDPAGVPVNASAAGAILWTHRTGIGLQSNANTAYTPVMLRNHGIPHGAVITRIKALVKPAVAEATSGNRMALEIWTSTPNFSTPADPTETQLLAPVRDNGTNNVQVIDSGALSITVNKDANVEAGVTASHDGATNKDAFIALQVTYDDPGPRNN